MNILTFGEILWDIFPNKWVIGGAPFNFCAHMAKLGADVSFITAVGKDELGEEARRLLVKDGVADAFVIDTDYPTGVCNVTVNAQGIPSYDLVKGVAYDCIHLSDRGWDLLKTTTFDAFYYGTLAQRSENSMKTLSEILSRFSFKHKLFDINIRQNFYTPAVIKKGLSDATILKVSREETHVFQEMGFAETSREHFQDDAGYYSELCRELAHRYYIDTILFTLDKDGAMVYDFQNDACLFSEKPTGKVVSTVGAGDSFSAAYLYYLLRGEPIEVCLNKAIILSDYVVQHLEAIPEYSKALKTKLAE